MTFNEKLKNLTILFVLNMLFTQTIYAQEKSFMVYGIVTEPNSTTTIPYVTVRAFITKTTSNPVYACVSDGNGRFNVELKTAGDYDLVFSFVGKQTYISHISINNESNVDLGKISLEDSKTELNEVRVYGQKTLVEVLPDKFIYNVADDPQSFNSNIFRIAEKAPNITVNRETGILLNNCTPLILINGKKLKSVNNNPVFYLRNTAASNIDKIEIVTNPGSKYDADESCGVLNIITKKNREASLMIGSEVDSNLGSGLFADFGFKYNKLSVNGNIAYNSTHKFDTEEHTERLNKLDFQNYKLIQSGETKLLGNDISKAISVDLSYEFDTLSTISFSAGYFQDNVRDTTFQENRMNDFSNNLVYGYNLHEQSDLKFGDYYLGINYEFISKNKRDNLVVSALKEVDFVEQTNSQKTFAVLNYGNSLLNYIQDENQDENTLQIDYVHNFFDKSQLNFGAKTIFRDNSSLSDKLFINSFSEENEKENFKNTQLIYALYSEYALKVLKNYNINAGLRFESTKIVGRTLNNSANDFKTNYSNLLPYLLLSTKTSKGVLLSASYNTKIARPNVYALNPTTYVIDKQSVYYGNPNLTSEILNSLSFDYSNRLKRIKQYLKLSYMFSNNSIQNISGIVDDVYYTTYTNDGKYKELKLNLNLSAKITSWLQYRIGGSGSYVKVQKDELINSGLTGIVNSSANLMLSNDYYIGMSGFYKFPTITLQGTGFSFYTYEIYASKAFLGDKLNVELTLSNPFSKTKKYNKTIETNEMRILTDKLNMGRKIGLSVYYTFNDKDVKARKSSKSVENDDLRGVQGAQ
jgi:hypothetical protein